MISDQELLLSHHLRFFPGIQITEKMRKDAEATHILCVAQAIRELAYGVVGLTGDLKSRDAYEFAVHGIVNRLQVLTTCFTDLTQATFGTFETAKTISEIASIDRDLNSLYINLLGAFDNYAWLIVYEFGNGRIDLTKRASIGLFRYALWQQLGFTQLIADLQVHDGWFATMKERRDPVAHRIPLSVPPAFLTEEETRRYYRLEQDYHRYRAGRDMEMAEDAKEQQATLGAFRAIFKHHSRESATEIYPTIPEDCATMVAIGRLVNAFIKQHIDTARQAEA